MCVFEHDDRAPCEFTCVFFFDSWHLCPPAVYPKGLGFWKPHSSLRKCNRFHDYLSDHEDLFESVFEGTQLLIYDLFQRSYAFLKEIVFE